MMDTREKPKTEILRVETRYLKSRRQKAETNEGITGKTTGIGLDKRTSRRIVGSRVADYEHLTHKKRGPPGPRTAGRGTAPNYQPSTLNPTNQPVCLHKPMKIRLLTEVNRARCRARSVG
jgi:hypothetical protein